MPRLYPSAWRFVLFESKCLLSTFIVFPHVVHSIKSYFSSPGKKVTVFVDLLTASSHENVWEEILLSLTLNVPGISPRR
jgi:hypothetical protein